MLPLADIYENLLKGSKVTPLDGSSHCHMFSSVTGEKLDAPSCQPTYWVQNMVSTVRFSAALKTCLAFDPEIGATLEIGPHPSLQSPAQEVFRALGKAGGSSFFHSCIRNKDDYDTMLLSAGAMMARGLPVMTSALNRIDYSDSSHMPNVLTDLPSYQWDHSTSFWAESRLSRNVRFRQFSRHQLLGARYLEDTDTCPSWRNLLMLKEIPWLMEMKVSVPLSQNTVGTQAQHHHVIRSQFVWSALFVPCWSTIQVRCAIQDVRSILLFYCCPLVVVGEWAVNPSSAVMRAC